MKVKNISLPPFFESLSHYQKSLDRKIEGFINDLIELGQREVISSDMGVVITKGASGDDTVAYIASSVGQARLVRSWCITDSQLEAVLTIERQQKDRHDVVFFEPVMHVYIPQNSLMYFHEISGKITITNGVGGSQLSYGLYDFIQMILLGIIDGPQYCE